MHARIAFLLVLAASGDARAIVNGTETTDYPAVVAVLDGGLPNCTGTLVTKRVVVTAAHCVLDGHPLAVYIGTGADPGIVIDVADARHHPGFDPQGFHNDVAVLLLAVEAPVDPIPMFGGLWDASFLDRDVTLVGFGTLGVQGAGGLKRMGTARLVGFDDTSLTFTPDPAQTCSGDSGGPALLDIGGTEILVGITSFGDLACDRFGTDARADRYESDFVGPYIAAQSRGGRFVGALCRAADQCIEQRCEIAALGDAVRYCTRACDRDDQCPGDMACANGICAFADGGPAGLGAACTANEDCGSGICAAFDPGEPGHCAAWCAPVLEATVCGADACRPNALDDGTFVCGPEVPLHAGCATSHAASWLIALLVVVSCRRIARRGGRAARAGGCDPCAPCARPSTGCRRASRSAP